MKNIHRFLFLVLCSVSSIIASDHTAELLQLAQSSNHLSIQEQAHIAGQILHAILNQNSIPSSMLYASSDLNVQIWLESLNSNVRNEPYIHNIHIFSALSESQTDELYDLPDELSTEHIQFATSGHEPWSVIPMNDSTAEEGLHMLENFVSPLSHNQINALVNQIDPSLRAIWPIQKKKLDIDHYALKDIRAAVSGIGKFCASSGAKIINHCFSCLTVCKSIFLYPLNYQRALQLIDQCHAHSIKSLHIDNEAERNKTVLELTKVRQQLISKVSLATLKELEKLNNLTHVSTLFEESVQPPTCPVCWDQFSDTVVKCTLACKHLLCTGCFEKLQHSTCPMCRAKI